MAPEAPWKPHGTCRGCDQPVLDRHGSVDPRRRWHPECLRAYKAGRWPAYMRHLVWRRDHGRCARCGARDKYAWEADHVVAVALGGRSVLENMQTLCLPCHADKTAEDNAAIRTARTSR